MFWYDVERITNLSALSAKTQLCKKWFQWWCTVACSRPFEAASGTGDFSTCITRNVYRNEEERKTEKGRNRRIRRKKEGKGPNPTKPEQADTL